MPTLNITNLLRCLYKQRQRLYQLYVDCKDNELSDKLLYESNYILQVIEELKKVK